MKAVFFDVDGTLWDDRMEIPQSTKVAIRKLQENGHLTFICSGRSRGNIRSENLLQLGFDGIIAACGNHVEMHGQILHERLLSDDRVEQLVRLFEECHFPVVLEGPKNLWISKHGFEEDPFVNYILKEMGKDAIPLNGYSSTIRINKFSGDILPTTDFSRVREEVAKDFDILEHTSTVVEFVPKGTSKATGIAWICRHLGIATEDTYAVGDSVNDLDMLRFVGHGIAMGNGTQPAKEAAEFVTSDIKENGIYHAMQHYGLL